MGPLSCLLSFFVVTVAGSTCSDMSSCSMKLYDYDNCMKTHHTAMEVRLHHLEKEMKALHEGEHFMKSQFLLTRNPGSTQC
jgi:hypothetical protein